MKNDSLYTQQTRRRRIDLRLPEWLLKDIDTHRIFERITRTQYIENVIKNDLKQRKILTEPKRKIKVTWTSIEDMPTEPEYE